MQKTIHIAYWKTAYGELMLGSFQDKLCLCDWRYRKKRVAIDQRVQKEWSAAYIGSSSDIIEEAKRQLTAYFRKELTRFDLPIIMAGSPFQQLVWTTLMQIPYGSTQSYVGLARSLDKEDAVRAVAAANGANALSIIVPCHRVLGSHGQLVGYAGGLEAKKQLLLLEDALPQHQLRLF